jgi:hypothetical protein
MLKHCKWSQISHTADYTWKGWKATYIKTIRGEPVYRIIRPNGVRYALSAGLPTYVIANPWVNE